MSEFETKIEEQQRELMRVNKGHLSPGGSSESVAQARMIEDLLREKKGDWNRDN